MRPIIPPPVIGLIMALGMWGAARLAPELAVAIPARLPLAAAAIGVGLVIEAIAVGAFFRAKTTVNPLAPRKSAALVTDGLYRFSRNPMYLGMLILLAGVAVWIGHLLAPVFLIFFVILINELQIKPEEAALEERFGDAYRAYKSRVRRWL